MPERSAASSSLALHQLEPVGVEARARLRLDPPQLLAIGVARQHRELRLRVAQRHLLALERHALREEAILELVLALRELRRGKPAFAGLAQAIDPLRVVTGRLLGLAQGLELLAAEEVGVAADDLRLLRHFLLADAHGAPLLRALEQVLLELLLEIGRRKNLRRRSRVHPSEPPRDGDERLRRERLRQDSVGRVAIFVDVDRAGDERDRHSLRPQACEQVKCLAAVEMDVEQNDIRPLAASAASASSSVPASSTVKPSSSRFTRHEHAKRRVILDDERRGRRRLHSGSRCYQRSRMI